jgi:hypothetical protein
LNEAMIFEETAFALSSVSFSIGPNPNALVGQVRTHAGSRPCETLATQKSHLRMEFPSGNWGAPKGQAVAQAWHPMHCSWFTSTTPYSGFLERARVGQTVTQGASPQCMQANDTYLILAEG